MKCGDSVNVVEKFFFSFNFVSLLCEINDCVSDGRRSCAKRHFHRCRLYSLVQNHNAGKTSNCLVLSNLCDGRNLCYSLTIEFRFCFYKFHWKIRLRLAWKWHKRWIFRSNRLSTMWYRRLHTMGRRFISRKLSAWRMPASNENLSIFLDRWRFRRACREMLCELISLSPRQMSQ